MCVCVCVCVCVCKYVSVRVCVCVEGSAGNFSLLLFSVGIKQNDVCRIIIRTKLTTKAKGN